MYQEFTWPPRKAQLYPLLAEQAAALVEGEREPIARMANLSALLWQALPEINWAGFYRRMGEELVLGPFQGRPACVRIAFGKGVCGTAALSGVTQIVPNVHEFPGHIACDGASNSEIVVPVFQGENLTAVLDIDSPVFHRFSEADRVGLEQCAALLGAACDWNTY